MTCYVYIIRVRVFVCVYMYTIVVDDDTNWCVTDDHRTNVTKVGIRGVLQLYHSIVYQLAILIIILKKIRNV